MAGSRPVRLCFVRNRRARRYILRLRPDGAARVTVPRGGSLAEAKRFAERNVAWLESSSCGKPCGRAGPRLGRPEPKSSFGRTRAAGGRRQRRGRPRPPRQRNLPVADATGDLRPAIERHLRQLAARELPRARARTGRAAPTARAARHRPQPAVPLGLLFATRHHLPQLAPGADSRLRPRLPRAARTRAPQGNEPLPAVLERGGPAVPGISPRRNAGSNSTPACWPRPILSSSSPGQSATPPTTTQTKRLSYGKGRH